MRLLSYLIVIGLLIAGQGLRAGDASEDPDVAVEFSIYAWQTDLPKMRYSTKQVVDAVESDNRSDTYDYTGPATLQFYSSSAKLSQNGSKKPKPIASVTFPRGATRFTLVSMPKSGSSYPIYLVPENGDLLPPHFVQVHNFTEQLLFMSYDKDRGVQIPANGTAYIRPDRNVTVVDIYRDDHGKWLKLSNHVIELNPEERGNVILAPSEGRSITLCNLPAWPRAIPAKPAVVAPEPESTLPKEAR